MNKLSNFRLVPRYFFRSNTRNITYDYIIQREDVRTYPVEFIHPNDIQNIKFKTVPNEEFTGEINISSIPSNISPNLDVLSRVNDSVSH